jgi:hypothetical protein
VVKLSPTVEGEGSNMTFNNLQKLDYRLGASRPPVQRPRNSSFHLSEKTTSSTGRSSDATNSDLGFMTPGTSYNTGSVRSDDEKWLPSSNKKASTRQNIPSFVSEEDEPECLAAFNILPTSSSGKHSQVSYAYTAKSQLPNSPPSRPAVIESSRSRPDLISSDCGINSKACPQPPLMSRDTRSIIGPSQQPWLLPACSIPPLPPPTSPSSLQFGMTQSYGLRRKPGFYQNLSAGEDVANTRPYLDQQFERDNFPVPLPQPSKGKEIEAKYSQIPNRQLRFGNMEYR